MSSSASGTIVGLTTAMLVALGCSGGSGGDAEAKGSDSGSGTDAAPSVDSIADSAGSGKDGAEPLGDSGGRDDTAAASDSAASGDGGCGTCAAGTTCCGAVCVDTTSDEKHCGACGAACASDQFCGRSACQPIALQSLCALPKGTLIDDGLSNDGDAARAMIVSLAACTPTMSTRLMSPSTAAVAGVLDGSTQCPTLGRGDLLFLPGGPFGQKTVGYLERGVTPVLFRSDATNFAFVLRDTGKAIVDTEQTAVGPNHDWFLAELVREPTSGTVTFVLYGFMGPGTVAGAYWVGHAVLGALTSHSKQWYVVEWIDRDDDSAPDADDTFTIVASG